MQNISVGIFFMQNKLDINFYAKLEYFQFEYFFYDKYFSWKVPYLFICQCRRCIVPRSGPVVAATVFRKRRPDIFFAPSGRDVGSARPGPPLGDGPGVAVWVFISAPSGGPVVARGGDLCKGQPCGHCAILLLLPLVLFVGGGGSGGIVWGGLLLLDDKTPSAGHKLLCCGGERVPHLPLLVMAILLGGMMRNGGLLPPIRWRGERRRGGPVAAVHGILVCELLLGARGGLVLRLRHRLSHGCGKRSHNMRY